LSVTNEIKSLFCMETNLEKLKFNNQVKLKIMINIEKYFTPNKRRLHVEYVQKEKKLKTVETNSNRQKEKLITIYVKIKSNK
jgi:hypothetical protein